MSDVLGIAPHPDDLEISAGGTVAGLVRAGFKVAFVDLTEGERGTRGSRDLRLKEAEHASSILRLSGRENLGLPDGGLDASLREHMEPVVEAVRRHRPRLIITMHENDEHPDHQEAALLVRRAAYLAGLRNWPRSGAAVHRTPKLILAMGRRTFDPSFVVDVTAEYEVKREAIAAFHSQVHREASDPDTTPISDPGFLKALEARDRHFGSMVGVEFGEAFFADRPWRLNPGDLVSP